MAEALPVAAIAFGGHGFAFPAPTGTRIRSE
jgi:hypothetical protein